MNAIGYRLFSQAVVYDNVSCETAAAVTHKINQMAGPFVLFSSDPFNKGDVRARRMMATNIVV